MRRREFLGVLGGAATWPLAARAQQPGRIYRVGMIGGALDSPVLGPGYPAFREELHKRGFDDGQNLIVDFRTTRQSAQRLYADAADLVRSKVDVIVALGPEIALQAALAASPTIPIVMWANNFDPVERGYVKSLAQPGGSVTGVFTRQPELAEKQVELLREAFPERTRIVALWDTLSADQLSGAERAAQSLNLDLRPVKLENPPYDIAASFRRVAERDPQMLIVLSSPLFGAHDKEIAEETIRMRLPAMFIFRRFVVNGGLMSYGVHVQAGFRRLAEFVTKILTGTRPADLPVEQPTTFELILNLRTAKAIGLVLPTSLLLRADEVIE
jgi:ABC-type uncharacterized transport system substrate-binding protein